MKLEEISGLKRESLFEIRAQEWRGPLTVEEFSNRNRRLYQTPYGTDKIKTYTLSENGKILASMDILQVGFLLKKSGTIEKQDAFLLASCIVPKELRGKGYAKKLIDSFLETNGTRPGVLYSDIGPKYYEAFGFAERRVYTVEGKESKNTALNIFPLTLESFVEELTKKREKELAEHPDGAACLAPNVEFLSWQIERHKYFSSLKKTEFPKHVAFKVNHGKEEHLLFSVPNAVKGRQEGMWVTSGCILCEEALAHQAYENGLQTYMYWDLIPPLQIKQKECPMVKTGHPQSLFVDPQLCDWW